MGVIGLVDIEELVDVGGLVDVVGVVDVVIWYAVARWWPTTATVFVYKWLTISSYVYSVMYLRLPTALYINN